MPESIEINVDYHEGDEVYWILDQSIPYVVRGFVVRGLLVMYIVFSPETGEIEMLGSELTSERSMF